MEFSQLCSGTTVKIMFRSGIAKLLTLGQISGSTFWATDLHGEYARFDSTDVSGFEVVPSGETTVAE